MKQQLKYIWVWLRRIRHCCGFGVQSPTDYRFIRYVVNEHWPYYAYEQLTDGDWLTRKLGRLYFRIANWRQPVAMTPDPYQPYFAAGCRTTRWTDHVETVELARVDIADRTGYEALAAKCNDRSVVIVENIWRDNAAWRAIVADKRSTITFDLYYCGIVMFNQKRYQQNYIVNF